LCDVLRRVCSARYDDRVHRARVTIDLPSEELPPDPAILRVLRWIFTTDETKSDRHELVGSGLEWCRRLMAASEAGGLDDLIALAADGEDHYLDQEQQEEDFTEVLDAIAQRGDLEGGFELLTVVLSGHHEDWHALASIDLCTHADSTTSEISVEWSARSLGLRVQEGETAPEYIDRIEQTCRDPEKAAAAFAPPEAMLDRALERWRADLAPGVVQTSSRTLRVVVPGPTQVGRFRNLGFGRALRPRTYRPKAKEKRIGSYDEPQVYYFFDPYHDLLSWVVAKEVVAGRFRGPAMAVVDRHGETLPLGPGAETKWEVPVDAVTITDGKLTVDERVPQVSNLDLAEVGNPNAPGFAGSGDDG